MMIIEKILKHELHEKISINIAIGNMRLSDSYLVKYATSYANAKDVTIHESVYALEMPKSMAGEACLIYSTISSENYDSGR